MYHHNSNCSPKCVCASDAKYSFQTDVGNLCLSHAFTLAFNWYLVPLGNVNDHLTWLKAQNYTKPETNYRKFSAFQKNWMRALSRLEATIGGSETSALCLPKFACHSMTSSSPEIIGNHVPMEQTISNSDLIRHHIHCRRLINSRS